MTSMRSSAAFLFLLVVALQAFAGDNGDARFKEIYSKEWAWRQAQRGEIDEDSEAGRGGVSPQLPKVDVATQNARLEYWTGVMKQLDTIQAASLSPLEQTNYAVYRAQIE